MHGEGLGPLKAKNQGPEPGRGGALGTALASFHGGVRMQLCSEKAPQFWDVQVPSQPPTPSQELNDGEMHAGTGDTVMGGGCLWWETRVKGTENCLNDLGYLLLSSQPISPQRQSWLCRLPGVRYLEGLCSPFHPQPGHHGGGTVDESSEVLHRVPTMLCPCPKGGVTVTKTCKAAHAHSHPFL